METTNNLTLSNGCTIQEMIDNLHATRELLKYEEWEDRRYRYAKMAEAEIGYNAYEDIMLATAYLCENEY